MPIYQLKKLDKKYSKIAFSVWVMMKNEWGIRKQALLC